MVDACGWGEFPREPDKRAANVFSNRADVEREAFTIVGLAWKLAPPLA